MAARHYSRTLLNAESGGRSRVEIARAADYRLCAPKTINDRRRRIVAVAMRAAHSRVALRRAWWGVVVLFLVHGLVVSTWISRIPAVQTKLHLSNAVLGLTLLSSAVGAVLTIPAVGYFVSRFGSKRVCTLSSILFCLAVVLPGLAFT